MPTPRPVAVLAALVAVALLLGGAACAARSPEPRVTQTPAAPVAAAPAAPAHPEAVGLLRTWDAGRARAWARGDPVALAALYVPGSRAGTRDVAMLRAWTARGLRVRGLRVQLLSVREVARTATSRILWVTDRLVAGRAVGLDTGGRPLPRDGPSTRTIHLRLLDGTWRVAAVRPGEVGA